MFRKIINHAALTILLAVYSCAFAQSTQPAPAKTETPAARPSDDEILKQATAKALQRVDAMQMLGVKEPASPLGDDPLGDLSRGMTIIHYDLSDFKTGQPVQVEQKQVVADLETLIKMLDKGGGTGKGNTPNGGRKQSIIAEGDPSYGALHDPNQQGKTWGQLPPKQREQILQSRTEGFPPGYEGLLQSYYQRLAQEKVTEEKPATPATQPAP